MEANKEAPKEEPKVEEKAVVKEGEKYAGGPIPKVSQPKKNKD